MKSESFTVHLPVWDDAKNTATFSYSLHEWRFAETVSFPNQYAGQSWPRTKLQSPVFKRLLNLAAAILGTSYFKLKAPPQIELEFGLSPSAHDLIKDTYSNGLGEFFARNDLNIFDALQIKTTQVLHPTNIAHTENESGKSLLLIGGGKDSLVSAQIMDAIKHEFVPFAVNAKGPILSSFDKLNRTNLQVKRQLDPEMIALSQRPENLNGHVPSTAINSIIACIAAHLFGFSNITLSNERSASEGNRPFAGRMVNHQHSKSLEFERLFSAALAAEGASLRYFSLLRPFSEAKIASLFARETKFDAIFSSCNTNFKQTTKNGDLWCRNCPKCRFVYLILAPHMPKQRLVKIFGSDLLDEPAQYENFAQLVGLTGHKPWECVGEIMEAAASVYRLSQTPEWQNSSLVLKLNQNLLEVHGQETLELAWIEAMNDKPDHNLPLKLSKQVLHYAN